LRLRPRSFFKTAYFFVVFTIRKRLINKKSLIVIRSRSENTLLSALNWIDR
jgi:hypothetical protein